LKSPPPKVPNVSSDVTVSSNPVAQTDSATEDDDDGLPLPQISTSKEAILRSRSPSMGPQKRPAVSPSPSIPPSHHRSKMEASSDSDSPPRKPPAKRVKPQASSSDDDSEAERKRQLNRGAPAKRGTRQPIKRGGKRF
jgi:hypothetical protein